MLKNNISLGSGQVHQKSINPNIDISEVKKIFFLKINQKLMIIYFSQMISMHMNYLIIYIKIKSLVFLSISTLSYILKKNSKNILKNNKIYNLSL